jgi:hypothetical protein
MRSSSPSTAALTRTGPRISARAIDSGSAQDLIAVATEVERILEGEEDSGQFGNWLQASFGELDEPGQLVDASC